MWAVKMENGSGHVEWFSTLSVRMQADSKEDARHFASKEEAEDKARMCERMPDAFSGAYWDGGRWTLTATVEPV